MEFPTCRVDFKLAGTLIESNHEFNLAHIQGLSFSKEVYVSSKSMYCKISHVSYNTASRSFEVHLV